jgi:hypothetical protein
MQEKCFRCQTVKKAESPVYDNFSSGSGVLLKRNVHGSVNRYFSRNGKERTPEGCRGGGIVHFKLMYKSSFKDFCHVILIFNDPMSVILIFNFFHVRYSFLEYKCPLPSGMLNGGCNVFSTLRVGGSIFRQKEGCMSPDFLG